MLEALWTFLSSNPLEGRRAARGRRSRVFFAVVLGALVFAISGSHAARADDAPSPVAAKKTSSLSWTRLEGAESCIGTHDLAQRVEALLHRPAIVSAADADLSIEGRAEKKTPKGFRATIVVAKSSGDILGKRELVTDDADCHALDEPVSLAIALMIDPDALASPPPPTEPTPTPTPPAPPPTVVVHETTKTVFVPVPMPPVQHKRPIRFEGYVGGLIGLGLTPVGGGTIAGFVVDPPHFIPIELNGLLLASEKSTPPTIPSGGTKAVVGTIRTWQIIGSSYLCPLAGLKGPVQAALCAGGQAGLIASSGSEFPKNGSSLRPVVNAAFRGRMGIWAFPFSFTIGATLGIPIIHDSYDYTAADGARKTLFQAAPVAGTFDLSIGLKFPDPSK